MIFRQHPYLALCVFVILLGTLTPTGGISVQTTNNPPEQVLTDDPIRIDGNDDLVNQASLNDWTLSGSQDGSKDRPYIISDYNFDTFDEPGIRIENTDLHIRLQSITLIIGGDNVSAVELNQVSNLLFLNTDITVYSGNNTGVHLKGCDNVRLVNLNIFGTTKDFTGTYGARFQDCRNSYVVSSSFHHLTSGFLAQDSSHAVIEDSSFEHLNLTAIQINASTQFFVKGNAILDTQAGIVLFDSIQNYVFENYVAGVYTGIASIGCHLNRFYSNQVGDPTYPYSRAPIIALGIQDSYNEFVFLNNLTFSGVGLEIFDKAYDNVVHWNNFINNSAWFVVQQIRDFNGTTDFKYNYISDHNHTDLDNNGFADEPYRMEGTYNYDNYTLTNLVEHTPSAITVPVLNQDYLGSISVSWLPLISSWHPDISYNLYYRAYAEDSWNLIASGLTSTSYEWDISGLDNGKYIFALSSYFNGTDRTVKISKPFFVKNSELSGLTLVYPNGGETVSGFTVVEWTPAIDNYNNPVYYSLYFSPDNGLSWKTIVELIEDTKYRMDFSQFDVGDSCLIKVVATNENRLVIEDISDAVFTVEEVTKSASSTTSTDSGTSDTTTEDRTDGSSITPSIDVPYPSFFILPALLVLGYARRGCR